MTTQIEAMKLALEALQSSQQYVEACANAKTKAGWGEQLDVAEDAITALREALAEQPSQKESLWCMKMNGCKTKCEDCPDEVRKQPAQQEPVVLPCCGYTDASAVKWNPYNQVVQCHNCGQVYTTPQAQPLEPVQCWKCGDMDPAFYSKCDVPACGMKEGKTP